VNETVGKQQPDLVMSLHAISRTSFNKT